MIKSNWFLWCILLALLAIGYFNFSNKGKYITEPAVEPAIRFNQCTYYKDNGACFIRINDTITNIDCGEYGKKIQKCR